MEIPNMESAVEPPVDAPQAGDPWKDELPPWTCAPTGPDVVYLLRICSRDNYAMRDVTRPCLGELRSKHVITDRDCKPGDFRYPQQGYVAAKLGAPKAGLFGFVDGIGDWRDMPRHKDAVWQVLAVKSSECKPEDMGVVRAPRGWIVYSGDALGALILIIPRMARNPCLRNAASDDDAHFWGRMLAWESSRKEIGSHTDNLVSFASETIAFTSGYAKFAVAVEGTAYSGGTLGCAVVLNGGVACSSGIFGDAIAQIQPRTLSRSYAPTYASAGPYGNAVALGRNAHAKAGIGGAIFLTEYGDKSEPSHVFAGIVDGRNLKPDTVYRLLNGVPIACDYR